MKEKDIEKVIKKIVKIFPKDFLIYNNRYITDGTTTDMKKVGSTLIVLGFDMQEYFRSFIQDNSLVLVDSKTLRTDPENSWSNIAEKHASFLVDNINTFLQGIETINNKWYDIENSKKISEEIYDDAIMTDIYCKYDEDNYQKINVTKDLFPTVTKDTFENLHVNAYLNSRFESFVDFIFNYSEDEYELYLLFTTFTPSNEY